MSGDLVFPSTHGANPLTSPTPTPRPQQRNDTPSLNPETRTDSDRLRVGGNVSAHAAFNAVAPSVAAAVHVAPTPEQAAQEAAIGARIADDAEAIAARPTVYRGAQGQYDAQGRQKFDCAGLIAYILRQMGPRRYVPQEAHVQCSGGGHMPAIGRALEAGEHPQRGDIVFFSKNGKLPAEHVGVFLGYTKDGKMIIAHASPNPKPDGHVVVERRGYDALKPCAIRRITPQDVRSPQPSTP